MTRPRLAATVFALAGGSLACFFAGGCGSQPRAEDAAVPVPAPVPADPRLGSRCVSRAAGATGMPVLQEHMVALTLGPEGPRWVSSKAVWDARSRTEQGFPLGVLLATGRSVLAFVGDGYVAATERSGLAFVDTALHAGRPLRGRNVATVLCGAELEETPTGAVMAYYAPEHGTCELAGAARAWFVQRLDAHGDGLGPAVPVGTEERRFLGVHPRWESGRVVLAVDAVGGERVSMVLHEDLTLGMELRGSVVCARAGCVRFAVVPSDTGASANYDSSAGTVRMDAVNYSNTFALGLFADEIIEARAQGDFALLVYRGRVNGTVTSRGVAVVNVPLRRLESVYDDFRGAPSLTWAEDAPAGGGVFVRTVPGRGFALGAGGWEQGGLLHRMIECGR